MSGGWGTADVGGAWTLNAATRFSVSGGAGRVQDASGSTLTATLPGVSSSATDLHATVSYAAQPDTATYLSFSGRVVGTADYSARLKVLPTGVTQLNLLTGSTVLAASTLPAGTVRAGHHRARPPAGPGHEPDDPAGARLARRDPGADDVDAHGHRLDRRAADRRDRSGSPPT